MDPVFIGDIANDPNSLPSEGNVPAPEHGDSNRNFYLSASGVWKAPSFLEPISLIKIPAGSPAVKITKLGDYDLIKLTFIDVLPTTTDKRILCRILSDNTTLTSSEGDYIQSVTGTKTTTAIPEISDVDSAYTSGFFSLMEPSDSPNPANSLVSNTGYMLGEYYFGNFTNTPTTANFVTMIGTFMYYSAGGVSMTGTLSGSLETLYTPYKKNGLRFFYSGGVTFAGGTIIVEGLRYNAAYNNNFTAFV